MEPAGALPAQAQPLAADLHLLALAQTGRPRGRQAHALAQAQLPGFARLTLLQGLQRPLLALQAVL